jgi:hypothetical protein
MTARTLYGAARLRRYRRERRQRREEPVPERDPRQRREQARGERHVHEEGEIERSVVGASPRLLVRCELVVHTERGYVRNRTPDFAVFTAERK